MEDNEYERFAEERETSREEPATEVEGREWDGASDSDWLGGGEPGSGCDSPDEWPDLDGRSIRELTAREVGVEGERLAASYLERRGFKVLRRNWRCPFGEVDIVCQDEDETVLVEVKTRLALDSDPDLMPELAVDRHKQLRYRRLALAFLSENPDVYHIRFDVIAINIVAERTARLRHLIAAFSWDE